MSKIITIPYKPRQWAEEIHESKKRWKIIVSHRRSGKTVSCINHLLASTGIPNSRYAYISPTYKQSKTIAWDYLKYYSRPIPGIKINESELRVDYPNGSRITLYGADNPDSLRGIALWGVVFDEYSQQPSNIFSEIIRPSLADHQGYGIWIGTPKGRNEFYRLYDRAKDDKDWLAVLLTVDDTKLIPEKELNDAKKLMTPDEFKQEWYCSFDASIKGAYYADELSLMRDEGRIVQVNYDEALRVHTVWDLGVGQNLAVGFYQKVSNEIHMIDFWEGDEKDGIPQAIIQIQNKSYIYGSHFAPHDINATDIGTGKTRRETASNLGITFEEVPRMSVADGINAGKLVFNRLFIDETKCSGFIDNLAQYRREWDDKHGMFKDRPCHDFSSHSADVHRYMAIVEREFTNNDYDVDRANDVSLNRQSYGADNML